MRPDPPFVGDEPTTDRKVVFLASGQGMSVSEWPVTVMETHMSWVFLGRTVVLKMKKPVKFSFLDFTTLERRRLNCEAELQLNRRLAAEVYRRVVPLRSDASGNLSMQGSGRIVEWLVEMRRLPANEMLDARIRTSRLNKDDVKVVARRLAQFYRSAPAIEDGDVYLRRFRTESAVNRDVLLRPSLGVANSRTQDELDVVDRLLDQWTPEISHRIANGWIVEGHGDLRPGHVCLVDPPCIYDCLEFDRSLRLLDPYDEVNYLGMECAVLGASWVRNVLLATLAQELGRHPDPRLVATYGAFRALLRARLCISHLLDEVPKDSDRWVRKTRRYLGLAARESLRASGRLDDR